MGMVRHVLVAARRRQGEACSRKGVGKQQGGAAVARGDGGAPQLHNVSVPGGHNGLVRLSRLVVASVVPQCVCEGGRSWELPNPVRRACAAWGRGVADLGGSVVGLL